MRGARYILYSALFLAFISLAGALWLVREQRGELLLLSPVPTRMATAAVPSGRGTTAPVPTLTALATADVENEAGALPPTFTPAAVRPSVTNPVAGKETASASVPTATVAAAVAESDGPPDANLPATLDPMPTPPQEQTAQDSPLVSAGCAEVPPKPEYGRYYLSNAVWPTPASQANDHFWLAKPFNGGGRFLINETFPYGYDGSGRLLLHNGVDAASPLGTPLLAVADGTVVVAQNDLSERFGWRCNWYGHLVVMELDQRWLGQPVYVLYGHVLEIGVVVGQHVVRGEQIAEVGVGGAADVPHLHFEVRVGRNGYGETRNPMLWIDPATRGVIAGRLLDPQGRPWRGVGLSLIGRSADSSEGNTWSYMEDPLQIVNIHPDEQWAENFLFSDVKPGEYDVYTKVQGNEYMARVVVEAGKVSQVDIVTAPYQPPTPVP